MEKNRNYFVAIALSVLVVFAWQFFYMGPRIEEQKRIEQARIEEAQKAEKAKQATSVATSGDTGANISAVPGADALDAVTNREEALKKSPRIAVETPSLVGSINLRGARLDDLKLKGYRETVDKASPMIALLNPANTKDGNFIELGYLAGADAASLPGPTTDWKVEGNATLTPTTPVVLTYSNPAGVVFTRTFAVDAKYMFTVTDKVTNASGQAISLSPYGRVTRYNKPLVAAGYVLHEGFVGILGGVLEEAAFKDIESEAEKYPGNTAGWFGITDKYWASAIVPPQGKTFETNFQYRTTAKQEHLYDATFLTAAESLASGATAEFTTRVFAGAKEVPVVDSYETSLNIPDFSSLIDWGWFYFLTKPMFKLMDFLNRYFGNFGLAILGTTVIVKLLFFPIANRQYASMAKMKMVQPKMEEMKAKFGDDRMGLQTAMMQLYKEEKINPVAGCWPIFLQIPVFFALYKVIFVTIEMRHAPFFGWIHDLSAPDPTTIFNLFGLLPFTPPAMLMLGVWPLIMGVTMFLQMRMNPTPPDPTQAMLFTWMPVIFTFMLASFPAGLVIYWAWNNTLSILQQGLIMRRNGAKIELFDNMRQLFRRKPSKAE